MCYSQAIDIRRRQLPYLTLIGTFSTESHWKSAESDDSGPRATQPHTATVYGKFCRVSLETQTPEGGLVAMTKPALWR